VKKLLFFLTAIAAAAVAFIGCKSEPPSPPTKAELSAWLKTIVSFNFSDDKTGGIADWELEYLVRNQEFFVERDSLLSIEKFQDYCKQLSLAYAAWQVKAMTGTIHVPGPDGGPYEVPYAYLDAVKYGSTTADIIKQSGVPPAKVLESMEGFIESFGIERDDRGDGRRSDEGFLDFKDEVAKIVAGQEEFILTGDSSPMPGRDCKRISPSGGFVPEVACCSGTVEQISVEQGARGDSTTFIFDPSAACEPDSTIRIPVPIPPAMRGVLTAGDSVEVEFPAWEGNFPGTPGNIQVFRKEFGTVDRIAPNREALKFRPLGKNYVSEIEVRPELIRDITAGDTVSVEIRYFVAPDSIGAMKINTSAINSIITLSNAKIFRRWREKGAKIEIFVPDSTSSNPALNAYPATLWNGPIWPKNTDTKK